MYRRLKNALLLILGLWCAASADAVNWSPTPSGKPTTAANAVYMPNIAWNTCPWPATQASPTYAHHPAVTKIDRSGSTGGHRLIVSFSAHAKAEDVRGQRICFCYSDDAGATWIGGDGNVMSGTTGGVPWELFDCPDAYGNENYEAPGYRLQNVDFFEYEGATYALCQCDWHPRTFPRTIAYFLREISIDGSGNTALGTIYRFGKWGEGHFPSIDEHADSAGMIAQLLQPANRPLRLHGDIITTRDYPNLAGSTTVRLTEPASVLLGNGDVLRAWRQTSNSVNNFWFSTISGGVETFDSAASPVPNDPAHCAFIRLSNGKLAMAGNFIANNQRKVIQLATSTNDGQDWQKIYEVWTQGFVGTLWPDATLGNQYKGGGQAYPCLIEFNGNLLVICSIRKESINCNVIPVSSL